jgi:DNA polymerase elongation subunit (family B)
MADYLYLDIETIPASDPATIAEIARQVTPPAAMKKAETIAEWEANQKAAAVSEAVAKTSFNGAFGRVCCIGWTWGDDDPFTVSLRPDGDEAEILREFAAILAETRPSNEMPIIVGHYVADFDLRFLWQRAFVLGVKMPAWWPRDPKPWSREVHDTMAMWAGAKDRISLDNLCKALRIEGKTGVDGSMVAGMWERGEYDAIASYCRDDVERVRNVHRKMLVAMGEAA